MLDRINWSIDVGHWYIGRRSTTYVAAWLAPRIPIQMRKGGGVEAEMEASRLLSMTA